jgi:hypothetical protein
MQSLESVRFITQGVNPFPFALNELPVLEYRRIAIVMQEMSKYEVSEMNKAKKGMK